MRIVHVVQPWDGVARPLSARTRSDSSDAGVLACRAAIAARPADEHRVVVIGGSSARERARAMGLDAAGCIAPALGVARAASGSIGRVVEHWGPVELIWAWSEGAAAAIGPLAVASVAFDVAAGSVRVRATSGSAVAIAPPVPSAWARPVLSDARRAAAPASDHGESLRIGLIGDPAGETDGGLLLGIVSLLRVAGLRTATGIADQGASGWRRIRRLSKEMLGEGCCVASDVPPAVSGGVDYAIGSGDSFAYGAGVLAAAAAARGVCIIAPGREWTAGFLPSETTSPQEDPPSIARTLMGIIESEGAAAAARKDASDRVAAAAGVLPAWIDETVAAAMDGR